MVVAESTEQRKSNKRRRNQPKKRKEPSADQESRRDRIEDTKRRRIDQGEEGPAIWQDTFTEEEIKNESRRKKTKVALIFGYSGTGYHGSQITNSQETVEGDLFRACVRAGAISKANSTDPKKIGWTRCSRTDRNVHAAANVISAHMIAEDEDITERINAHLPPQIRVWGLEKLSKGFNAYKRCDGRVYQYWIPTSCFIPPHPRTFLAIQLAELAQQSGLSDQYADRQREMADFWTKAEEEYIAPVTKRFDAEMVEKALQFIFDPHLRQTGEITATAEEGGALNGDVTKSQADPRSTVSDSVLPDSTAPESPLDEAVREIKEAYRAARRSYRIDETRLGRVRACMDEFQGTHNYWSYTTGKSAHEASAKRYIVRTAVGSAIEVRGTEWIPLDLHGQSFMLNQIRKMAFMAAMCVRCGADPATVIPQTFRPRAQRLNVPKAPPTGLLLERPIFDAFNSALDRLPDPSQRSRIDFEKFRTEIEAFKREHIIEPMHVIEEREAIYYNFFQSLDSLRSNQLLYFSAAGLEATQRKIEGEQDVDNVFVEDDEGEAAQADGGDD